MKIYTKTGDKGETGLFGGARVPKTHLRVEAYGTIDELNANLGLARSLGASPQVDVWLNTVQHQLFQLGSDLATPLDAKSELITRLSGEPTAWLEATIDQMTAELDPLRNFILPGGTAAAAQLQVARAVCRRAERLIVALRQSTAINDYILAYVNRLSDWLFTLARLENMRAGESETKWSVRL